MRSCARAVSFSQLTCSPPIRSGTYLRRYAHLPFFSRTLAHTIASAEILCPGCRTLSPTTCRFPTIGLLASSTRCVSLGTRIASGSRLTAVRVQGTSYFNPTQRTISLFQKLLNIAELPLERDRLAWASTNLLIDPQGQLRDFQHTHNQPKRPSLLDDDIFDNEPSVAAKAGYGQVEFESPWDGGLDVRILDVKKFRTSSGRLGRKQFDFEKKRHEEALYFHCRCCGDVVSLSLPRFHRTTLTRRPPCSTRTT